VDDFAGVLRALTDGGVRFVVVGGIAVVAHGHLRGTKDIDVVVDPAAVNLERLRGVLRELGATKQNGSPLGEGDLEAGRPWNLRTALAFVDVLPDRDVPFGELEAAATERRVDGVPVPVCSLEHLVRLKRAAGRTKDVLDLQALRDALGELPG
jgi:predicted nucleotidyltransferase